MNQPPDLLAEDKLKAFQVELSRCVAREMSRCFLSGFSSLARNLPLLPKIVLLIDVEFDVALGVRY